jgi:CheY-like chemotaxis protein
VRVRIRDNGAGLPTDMLSAIFGIFVQVPGTARIAQGGLGIGLTLVKSLVELHGGNVRAASEGLGKGTEVIVELPLAGMTEAAHDPTMMAVPVRASALLERILVVDDNRDAADSLAALLEALGAAPFVAYDGLDALDIASQVRPTAAILDIGMPGMDGCELAQRLRASVAHADMLLIALSGWGQADDRERIAAAGFDHHLLKPADVPTLVALLSEPRHPAQAKTRAK